MWIPPDPALPCLRLTPGSDVYSFGVLLWSLYSGQQPCVVRGGLNTRNPLFPHFPSIRTTKACSAHSQYKSLAHQCLRQDPHQRPSFADMTHSLAFIFGPALSKAGAGASCSGSGGPASGKAGADGGSGGGGPALGKADADGSGGGGGPASCKAGADCDGGGEGPSASQPAPQTPLSMELTASTAADTQFVASVGPTCWPYMPVRNKVEGISGSLPPAPVAASTEQEVPVPAAPMAVSTEEKAASLSYATSRTLLASCSLREPEAAVLNARRVTVPGVPGLGCRL